VAKEPESNAMALVSMASEFYTKTRALFKLFVGVRTLSAIRRAAPGPPVTYRPIHQGIAGRCERDPCSAI